MSVVMLSFSNQACRPGNQACDVSCQAFFQVIRPVCDVSCHAFFQVIRPAV